MTIIPVPNPANRPDSELCKFLKCKTCGYRVLTCAGLVCNCTEVRLTPAERSTIAEMHKSHVTVSPLDKLVDALRGG